MEPAGNNRNIDAFNREARLYDTNFSQRLIGRLQREQVWWLTQRYLKTPSKLFELNGGTGEDALYLQKKGFSVTTSDGAANMCRVMKEKGLEAHCWDLRQPLPAALKEESYAYFFSNFSGINCLNEGELIQLGASLASIAHPDSLLLLVVFGKKCWWERAYGWYSGQPKLRRRRQQTSGEATLQGQAFAVYYYPVETLQACLKPHFTLVAQHPVGLLVPPSYLQKIESYPRLLKLAQRIDLWLNRFSNLSDFGDHTLLVWKRRAS